MFSSDHVLDVWIDVNGGVRMKDEDELEAAIEQGLFTATEGKQIQEDARVVLRTFRAGRFLFNELWPDWRPDLAWERPVLPENVTWEFDQLDA